MLLRCRPQSCGSTLASQPLSMIMPVTTACVGTASLTRNSIVDCKAAGNFRSMFHWISSLYL